MSGIDIDLQQRYIVPEQERVTIMLKKDMVEYMEKNGFGWTGPVELAFEKTRYEGMVMWLRNAHPVSELQQLIDSDRFLDFVLDELTEAAGYDRNMTSPLNLARWDLKAALRKGIEREKGKPF